MSDGDSRKTLREHLRDAQADADANLDARGFGLTMSSGFFAFFAHTGLLTVLEDEGLLPSRVSGSSAGALATGSWAAGLSAPALANELERLRREDFWDPGVGFGLLRGRLFRERLASLLPVRTFDACRIPVALSVFDVLERKTRVLRDGDLATAVCASCAVPLLFQPVWIEGRAYLDGGIRDRPGLSGMPDDRGTVLFHHITSKSPWRMRNDIPRRPGMITLVIDGLPRSGPFKLAEGRRAFRAAREAAKRALDVPVEDGLVAISV